VILDDFVAAADLDATDFWQGWLFPGMRRLQSPKAYQNERIADRR